MKTERLNEWRKTIDKKKAQRDHLTELIKDHRKHLLAQKEYRESVLEAQKIVQGIALQIQTEAHNKIADVVSRCLEAVFGDDAYQFRITFEQKRGRTEASLAFVRDGVEIDPMSASGGGAVDVAAFALRVACLVLSRPPLRRVLFLDEAFRFLSLEYRPRVAEMIESLAQELEIQFILVTHSPELQIGKVYAL